MLKAVIQTCDACGIEGSSTGMHVPDGWLFFDLRGGKEPGEIGYGWNVCGTACMQAVVLAWADGKKPIPYGMSEESQVIRTHGHDHADPAERDIEMMAAAAAEIATRSHEHEIAPGHTCLQCGSAADNGPLPEGWVSVGDRTGADELCSVNCAIAHFAAVLNAHH